jgi:hypothetical protein
VCERLAEAIPDHRDQSRIDHTMVELFTERACAIACGHKDGNDLNQLRHDPLMKIAVGRCPESGDPLASQSTISRLENAPTKTEAARLTAALIDQFCTSVTPGKEEIFDIDDAFYTAHGGQSPKRVRSESTHTDPAGRIAPARPQNCVQNPPPSCMETVTNGDVAASVLI